MQYDRCTANGRARHVQDECRVRLTTPGIRRLRRRHHRHVQRLGSCCLHEDLHRQRHIHRDRADHALSVGRFHSDLQSDRR